MDEDTTPIRVDVPISLHPDTLLSLAKPLDQEGTIGRNALSAAREALKVVYDGFGRMNDAEQAIKLAQGGQDGLVAAADKAFARMTPMIDRRLNELKSYRDQLSAKVATAVDEPTRKSPEGLALASEVRAHVKALPETKRLIFVSQAIQSGDRATAAAILHAQPFLSGFDAKAHALLRAQAAGQFAPTDTAQLEATEAALERASNAGSALLGRYTKIAALRVAPAVEAARKVRALAEG